MKHLVILILATAATVPNPGPAQADLGDQLFKLLPDDGAALERFGYSVAISGPTAIVGAYRNDGFGAAYLFDTSTGRQLFNLLPKDGFPNDNFGISVAISCVTAIAGANKDWNPFTSSGSAYLFGITTGRQLFKLLPNDPADFDEFGISVAFSGPPGKEIAIAGAWRDDDNGSDSGSAYLFDITTGQQLFKLLANDGAIQDIFGWSVAVSGATAIVGSPSNNENANNVGAAYLFDTTMGQQLFKLLPNDGAANDSFGISVAISGTTVIVGAHSDDVNGNANVGSAYLFDISDPANPTQLFKLLANDGAGGDSFGSSVAISGPPGKEVAIVGAGADDDNGNDSGSAYLFDISDLAKPTQIAKLLADDGAALDLFGRSVALSGETAIVGAWRDDDNGDDSGSAFLFDAAGTPCPWDLDANGSVGASDLLSLLASWGPCKGCPADFDSNGIVGASDLLALLANWGLCL